MEELHYQFSILEAAFVIYHSTQVTLQEKMDAWLELTDTMPDCSITRQRGRFCIESLHEYLKCYIEFQKQSLEAFYNHKSCVYCYEIHEISQKEASYFGWSGLQEPFFGDYKSCLQHCIQNEFTKNKENDVVIDKICILKCPINKYSEQIQKRSGSIILNRNLDILEVDTNECSEDYDLFLEGLCFDFPTPFRRGDILTTYEGTNNRPFVLSYIATWGSKEMMEKGFQEHECPVRNTWNDYDKSVKGKICCGDYTNMQAFGTVLTNEMDLYWDSFLGMSIDLEYFQKPLENYERQLQLVSLYEKRELDGITLTNCCSAIRMEEVAKKVSEQCVSIYLPEYMEKAGMLPDSKN